MCMLLYSESEHLHTPVLNHREKSQGRKFQHQAAIGGNLFGNVPHDWKFRRSNQCQQKYQWGACDLKSDYQTKE